MEKKLVLSPLAILLCNFKDFVSSFKFLYTTPCSMFIQKKMQVYVLRPCITIYELTEGIMNIYVIISIVNMSNWILESDS